MRSTSRIVGCSINTVVKLLLDVGEVAAAFHDQFVRNLCVRRVECDEIWAFCYAKDKTLPRITGNPEWAGSIWTWTGVDPDSKMFISWYVGTRELVHAKAFMDDLGGRLSGRVQITSDGWGNYVTSIERTFGSEVDYAQVVKNYDDDDRDFLEKRVVQGQPDLKLISTSIVERMNLTMRMSMRRYSRRTNAHSKKFQNHCAQLALYVLYYNFCRPHLSLANPYPRTPAMAVGLADRIFDLDWVLDMLDAVAPKVQRPPRYRKRGRK